MAVDFTEAQIERYSRHILLPEIGVAGQRRLLNTSAFVMGAGGLGSPAILYLAAAGVGRIGIADHDTVDLSNLQRQIAHKTATIGRNKALSAKDAILALNPDCEVTTHTERVKAKNIREIIGGYDVVLDGSDNYSTRFLLADCCYFEKIPLVSAAVLRFEGQLLTVLPGTNNPCYRCLVPTPPPPELAPKCSDVGVLGAVVGVLGTLQATEAIKVLVADTAGKNCRLMNDRFISYDALDGSFRTLNRRKDPACPLCSEAATITELTETSHAACVVNQSATIKS